VRYEACEDLSEPTLQSFIVRVWSEESLDGRRTLTWRGCVVHVPSGKQRYITELNEVTAFIASYVEREGASPDRDAPAEKR